ncbi:hypothetical protein AURDEDRAFT_162813 [Auricularia subglabra TFB-10046 SS5]|nr:hypothetical protein AURDEDRAFT_162813 [Auricularia subglabra TFB-10046 SS5]
MSGSTPKTVPALATQSTATASTEQQLPASPDGTVKADSGTTTLLRFGSLSATAPDSNVYQYGIPSAPGRSQEGYRSAKSLLASSTGPPASASVGIPPLTPSPSPLPTVCAPSSRRSTGDSTMNTPSENAPLDEDIHASDVAADVAGANDSGETVRATPVRQDPHEELLRLYQDDPRPVNLNEPGRLDVNSNPAKPAMVATLNCQELARDGRRLL